MRISVNLASRPFIELRPFFARLRIMMAVLAAIAIGLGIFMHFGHKKLLISEQQMDVERREKMFAFWKKAVTRSFDWLEE